MVNVCKLGQEISRVWGFWKPKSDITFFEVKELYNLAYEQKAQARIALRQYRRIEARAQAMDKAYRAQLGLNALRKVA